MVAFQLQACLEVQMRREVLSRDEILQLLHEEVVSGTTRAALYELANHTKKSCVVETSRID